MRKNFDEIFSTIEIDTVTGRYFTTIPEEIINELDLYEDTELKWRIDAKTIIIEENEWSKILSHLLKGWMFI